jgi:hypothetical protein
VNVELRKSAMVNYNKHEVSCIDRKLQEIPQNRSLQDSCHSDEICITTFRKLSSQQLHCCQRFRETYLLITRYSTKFVAAVTAQYSRLSSKFA